MPLFTEEDLRRLEAKLAARGVKDVKLTLDPRASSLSLDEVNQDVAAALQAYLNGETKELSPVDIALLEVDALDKPIKLSVIELARLQNLSMSLRMFAGQDDRAAFREWFNAAREVLGQTDESLATLLGVSTPTIQRWSAGESAPHPLAQQPILTTMAKAIDSIIQAFG